MIKLNITAIKTIFTLSFTFPIPARILKLIPNKKLNSKNKIEYCKIFHESKNLSPKSTNAIGFANTKKKTLNAIARMIKLFISISFRSTIFVVSFFA